jgi:hypothetical protein
MLQNRSFDKTQARKLVFAGLIALAISVTFRPVAAQDIPSNVVVNGGGRAILLSPSPEGGKTRAYPIQFAIIAGFDGDAPKGYINFVFGEAFSRVWGAVPPNDAMYLSGKISNITSDADGFIHLTGTLTEMDFTHGDGVVFLIDDLFDIQVGGDFPNNEFILQWCLLPEFLVRVTRGMLTVNPNVAPLTSRVTTAHHAGSAEQGRSSKCAPVTF